jgi:hypothetical protein
MFAHLGGLPVEELAAQLLAVGAGLGLWLATRVRGRARR